MQHWAAKNQHYLETSGQVGFGRDCVGIVKNDHYPDVDCTDERLCAPEEVEHAYHKTDCLCVLGHGTDRLHELYLWVKKLADNGAVIITQERQPENQIDLLVHGLTESHVVIP